MARLDQKRVMGIVMAGINFKIAHEKLSSSIRFLDIELKEATTLEDVLLIWERFYFNAISPFDSQIQDAVTLITEHAHFRSHKRYNELHAKYMREAREAKRAGLPVPQIKRDPLTDLTKEELSAADAELAALWNSIKKQE